MNKERLKEINKRTDAEVKAMHQAWIDSRDKEISRIAKKLIQRLRKWE